MHRLQAMARSGHGLWDPVIIRGTVGAMLELVIATIFTCYLTDVAVIDVDSPSKITGRKPPTKYIPEGLRGIWSYVDKQTVCLEFDVLHDRCICSCC